MRGTTPEIKYELPFAPESIYTGRLLDEGALT